MKLINGFTYSKNPFEGWKFRARVKVVFTDLSLNNRTIDIYTDCVSKHEANNSIHLISKFNTITLKIKNWISKREDELTDMFIEEILKD